ncbi:MFS transporter [Lactobacillus sp. ESL0785]|uniref:MFS transporter n=1 Tax=Lactobacillus sp. ESL0785 TaxID=2983232 RepID=UPI0023F627C0|nr:MFS transporter [Lactobacillus sp. ESL0785]WEV70476.1 MFS transporter [Lactobacillus sp. ESL0785]
MKNQELNNKRKLLLGYTVSGFGDQFYTFAVPLLILAFNHSPVTMGLLTATEYLPTALFGLVIGVLFDIYNKRRVMLITLLAQMGLVLLIPIMIFKQWPFWCLLTAIFVFGTFDLLSWVGYQTMLAESLSAEELAQVSGQVGLVSSIQRMLGPGVASLIINVMGYLSGFSLDSVSFGYLAYIIKDVHEDDVSPKTQNIKDKITAGLKFIWQNQQLKWLIAGFFVANLGFQVVVPMLTFTLKQYLKVSVSMVSVFFTAAAIASILANFIYLHFNQKIKLGLQLIISGSLILAGFMLMLLLNSLLTVTLGYILVSFGSVWSQANFFTIVQALTKKEYRGMVTSAATTLTRIMGAVMAVVSGFLAKIDIHLIFITAASMMLISIYIMCEKHLIKLTL